MALENKKMFVPLRLVLLFIGLANSLTLPITGSVLSIWLMESGFDKEAIGLFALLGIPCSLKILWGPFIDYYCPFFFHSMPRKAWMLISLIGMSLSLILMSCSAPAESLTSLVVGLFFLSTFAGCFCVVGVSYELESQEDTDYSMGSACVTMGYRLGLLCGGAGALYLSVFCGWLWMLRAMALILFFGALLILIRPEPYKSKGVIEEKRKNFSSSSSLFVFFRELITEPCRLFVQNPLWISILILIFTFKMGDQLVNSMGGLFYLSLGFDKITLANAAKVWGMAATIVGAAIGGVMFRGANLFFAVVIMGLVHACSLVCDCFLAFFGGSIVGLYATVFIEHLTSGMAMVVFIAFLWRVCDRRYAATQYLLLYSLYSFKGDLFACLGGFLAAVSSWNFFFILRLVFSVTAALLAYRSVYVAHAANRINDDGRGRSNLFFGRKSAQRETN